MHYYLEDSDIYLLTTIGMKTQYLDANSEMCLQVEDIRDPLHWRPAIVDGRASRLTEQEDIDRVMHLIKERNQTLSPAIEPGLMLGDVQR